MRKRKYVIILCILNLIYSILISSFPILSSLIVDTAVKKNNNELLTHDLSTYFIIFISIVILLIGVYTLEQYLYYRFYLKMEYILKNKLYNKMLKTKTSSLATFNSGKIQQLYITDVDNIIKSNLDIIPAFFKHTTRILLAISILIFIDYKFLIIILICGIIGFFAMKVYSKLIRPKHKYVLEQEGNINSFIGESIDNIKMLKTNYSYVEANTLYNQLLDKQLITKRKRNHIILIGNSGMFVLSYILGVFTICYGAYFISIALMTYGTLIALIQLLNNIQNPVLSLSSLLNSYNYSKTSIERIKEFMNLEEDDTNQIKTFDKIIFDNVSFSYDKIIHSNLNFEINKKDTVMLSGPSGIGKSTIFLLLLGFIKPNDGKIYIESNGEKKDLDETARSLFSYVPQENLLFSGTILENIKLLSNKDNLDDIINALKLVNIYDEILSMPSRLDTKLLERGSGLSLGQIQRIIIAIAILNDKEIFMLDEFSSQLDSKNEEIIINNIMKLNKTVIFITHKDIKIENAKIIRLE